MATENRNNEQQAANLIDLIHYIVRGELDQRDNTVLARVVVCNSDETFNIVVVPDDQTVVERVKSISPDSLKEGDYVYVYKFQNKLSNAIIIAKVGNDATKLRFITTDQYTPLESGSSGGGGGGGGSDKYHTPVYSSGLKIGNGTNVADLFVPYAGSSQNGIVTTGNQEFSGTKTFNKSGGSNGQAIIFKDPSLANARGELGIGLQGWDDCPSLILQDGANDYTQYCNEYILNRVNSSTEYTIQIPRESGEIALKTYVQANPGNTSGTLSSIKIGNTNYAISGSGGSSTNVEINGVSITSNAVADIQAKGTYNATTNKLTTVDSIPTVQATTVVVGNALTNLNSRYLSNYEATLDTSGYVHYDITYGGNQCTEEQARNYMEHMCGSRYLPMYDYEYPKNTIFVFADRSIWKPQYDSTNGLELYRLSTPLALASDITPNYYPTRIYTTGLKISNYSGSDTCELYVPYANGSSQAGVVSTTDQTFSGRKTFDASPVISGIYNATKNGEVAKFSYGSPSGSAVISDGHFIAYGDDDDNDSRKPINNTGFYDLDTAYYNTGIVLYDADDSSEPPYKLSFPGKSGTLATTDDVTVTDVQVNGTSVVSSKIANILTNTAYNASTNKVATMTDISNAISGAEIEIVDLTVLA